MEDEEGYINLVSKILSNGKIFTNDSHITLYIFGTQLKFNLTDKFPILTTKFISLYNVANELLWFISGSCDTKDLSKKGVCIWDGNSTREYLDSKKFYNYPVGIIGPSYGYQMRNFGGEYGNDDVKGKDQIKYIIDKIQNDPESRSIIMSLWNPIDVHKTSLHPCHILSQFDVNEGKLNCSMYMRSVDVGLGLPYNISSYSLLTYILSHICHLTPGTLTMSLGNTHIYLDHIEPLKKQMKNSIYPFPTLRINRQITDIADFTSDDFTLINYKHHGKIYMKLTTI